MLSIGVPKFIENWLPFADPRKLASKKLTHRTFQAQAQQRLRLDRKLHRQLAQTTLPMEQLEDVVRFCLHKATQIKVFNTICNATSTRQAESAALAKQADVMIVVGGKNSANTRRLAEVCLAIQPKTYHIEVASELDPAWFADARSVGITSGASTPGWLINELVERISAMC